MIQLLIGDALIRLYPDIPCPTSNPAWQWHRDASGLENPPCRADLPIEAP